MILKQCEFTVEVTFLVCCHPEILLLWQRDLIDWLVVHVVQNYILVKTVSYGGPEGSNTNKKENANKKRKTQITQKFKAKMQTKKHNTNKKQNANNKE